MLTGLCLRTSISQDSVVILLSKSKLFYLLFAGRIDRGDIGLESMIGSAHGWHSPYSSSWGVAEEAVVVVADVDVLRSKEFFEMI